MEKLYFRLAYFYFGRAFYPGDYADPEIIKPHIIILNKNSRNLVNEDTLKECILSGAIVVPPKSEYYDKAQALLSNSVKKDSSPKEEPKTEPTPDSSSEDPKLYKREDLESLKMGKIRVIGRKYDVKDNDKSELIDKILQAQEK